MCMKMRRRLKRFLGLLLLLLLLVGGAWTGVWYVVSGRLIAHAAAWEEARRAEGWTIRHDPPRRTGWPMAAAIAFDHLSISGGRAYLPGGLSWTAASLTVALDIRHFNALSFTVSGRQSLGFAGHPPLTFQAKRMRGQAALLPGDRLGLVQMDAEGVLAAIPGAHRPEAASIGRLDAALRYDGTATAQGQAMAFAAEGHDIHLPPSHLAALGDAPLLAVDLAFSGPVPPHAAQSSAEANAAAWRRAGGSMTINRFRLVQGPLRLTAQGRFDLDTAGRPEGQGQLRAEGVAPALSRLAARHVMTASEARAMTAMLSLLDQAERGQADGGAGAALPLALHDGIVKLGPIPLLRLEP